MDLATGWLPTPSVPLSPKVAKVQQRGAEEGIEGLQQDAWLDAPRLVGLGPVQRHRAAHLRSGKP